MGEPFRWLKRMLSTFQYEVNSDRILLKGQQMFKRLFLSILYFVIFSALVFFNNPIKQLVPIQIGRESGQQ